MKSDEIRLATATGDALWYYDHESRDAVPVTPIQMTRAGYVEVRTDAGTRHLTPSVLYRTKEACRAAMAQAFRRAAAEMRSTYEKMIREQERCYLEEAERLEALREP